MNYDLALALFDSGIVQFGQFTTSSGAAPMRLDFAMLASYVVANHLLAQACSQYLQLESDEVRLCCALDTLPVGLVVGQMLERPIIYTTSREHELPREFIGAYDVGHPTVLLWSWPKSPCSDDWKHQMSQVGLQFHRNLYIVGGRNSVLPIDYLLECLVTAGRIRPVQAEACLHWLQVS